MKMIGNSHFGVYKSHRHIHSFSHRPRLLSRYNGKVEYMERRLYVRQSLARLLYRPSQKKFAGPWIRTFLSVFAVRTCVCCVSCAVG